MSRYTYVGPFTNPAKSFFVEQTPNEKFRIMVREFTPCDCGCPNCHAKIESKRPHTSAPIFEDEDEALEYIEGIEQFFEEDYDDYLNEHHHEIVQMERYEMWRNEY